MVNIMFADRSAGEMYASATGTKIKFKSWETHLPELRIKVFTASLRKEKSCMI